MRCLLIFISLLGLWSNACSQVKNASLNDEYGVVVQFITDSCMVYCTKDSDTLHFAMPLNMVEYEGGERKLKYEICQHVINCEDENNVPGLVFILFDDKLHIKEIRAIKIPLINIDWHKLTYNYLQYLRQTEGKWRIISKKSKYYLYSFRFLFN